MKAKSVYFMRRHAVPLQRDNYRELVIAGDLSNTTFNQLSSFVHEVAFSILGNTTNHVSWPAVVSDDVTRHVSALVGRVDVSEGLVNGKTVLPMPVESRKYLESTTENGIHENGFSDGRTSSASENRSVSSASQESTHTKYVAHF